MASDCREQAVSEEYVDFIWQQNLSEEELDRFFPDICRQPINNFYTVFYVERAFLPPGEEAEYGFEVLPALYAPLQTESLEAANILQLQNQPVLELTIIRTAAFRIRRERAGSWLSGIRQSRAACRRRG